MTPKIPVSVLVLVHTPELDVLLIERAARPGFWQSVTGSLDSPDEPLIDAAVRELLEETGIAVSRDQLRCWNLVYSFEIYAEWRHRFIPGARYNSEHVFSVELTRKIPAVLAPDEHRASLWLPWKEAARKCFSWSNRDAILMLPERRRAWTPSTAVPAHQ